MNRRAPGGVALLVGCTLWLIAGAAAARVVQEKLDVPVTVNNAQGVAVTRDVVVTVFFDDASAGPRPLLVLNHGRAADREGRAALGRAQYTVASQWFAQHGFVVVIPTRIGYGVTGGEDVEDTGRCEHKNYDPAYAASADLTLQVITAMRRRRDVAPDRTVVVGQSFGGATSITLAARNPPGVQAYINFAGGGGGNPKDRPQRPCAPEKLERLFAGYGKTARAPTLWIYCENDMYFGPKYPRAWFDAFRAAGGIGEFHQFPANGDDGHRLFSAAPELWQPRVLAFLNANGFALEK